MEEIEAVIIGSIKYKWSMLDEYSRTGAFKDLITEYAALRKLYIT